MSLLKKLTFHTTSILTASTLLLLSTPAHATVISTTSINSYSTSHSSLQALHQADNPTEIIEKIPTDRNFLDAGKNLNSPSALHCIPLTSLHRVPTLDFIQIGNELQCGGRRVPSHLLMAGYTNRVNLKLFETKISGKSVRWRENKKKYMIDKDKDGHKGSCWKLLDRNGQRIASLNCIGEVVGK